MTLTRAAYSSNGQWRFTMICEKCAEGLELMPFDQQLREAALDSDFEATQKEKRKAVPDKPLNPPIAAEKPKENKDFDKKFLKDMGIEDEL
jgi:hypothetical protein